jgi:dihydropteroate synthase
VVRDPSYRIATAEDGIHVFNNEIHEIGDQALAFFPSLQVEKDGAHAFYLGAELMKAETAWALGKRYVQDAPLDWGCAAPSETKSRTRLADAGHTLRPKTPRFDDP